MENKKSEEISKKFWYLIGLIALILIIVVTVGFIIYANRKPEVIDKKVKGGSIVLNYTDNITGLSLKNIKPTTDAIGIKNEKDGEYFDFSIDIELNKAKEIDYELAVVKDDALSTISDDDIKIYLEKEDSGTYNKVFGPESYKKIKKDTKLGSPEGSMVLLKEKRKKDAKENYRLRMWLSDKSVTKQGNYSVEVIVNGIAK